MQLRPNEAGSVCLVTHRYAPALGGVERVVEQQARELLWRGIAVEVITCDPTRKLPRIEVRDGIVVRRFPTIANDSIYYVAPQLGAWLMANARRFGVVHAHSFHTPLAFQSALATRFARAPLFVSPHYHGTGHTPLRSLLHGPYRPVGAWTLRHAELVMCNTRTEEALIHKHFGRQVRTTVIPNGVDADELAEARVGCGVRASGTAGLEVLSVGRLDTYKATERLIEAMPHLPGGSRLVLVGDGSNRARLEQHARALGISDNVRFTGQVSRSDLIAHYRAADVFASLSRYESFGLAVLEAGVAGLPVLASDLPAHQEVAAFMAQARVQFVPRDAPAEFVAQMLVQTAATGRETDLRGWPLPTWSNQADIILSHYKTALAQRRVPA